MCYWPPVCGLFLNYKVVEFQPRTVTPPKNQALSLIVTNLFLTHLPSPPSVRFTSDGGSPLLPQHPLHRRPTCFHTGSSAHPGVTCLRPIIPIIPFSPLPFAVSKLPPSPSLALTTPSRFPSPLLACHHQNLFYRDLQLCNMLYVMCHVIIKI